MCGKSRDVVGDVPPICPDCGLAAHWTTIATSVVIHDEPMTDEDRRFLYQIRIASE
jgi:hypothetical protein